MRYDTDQGTVCETESIQTEASRMEDQESFDVEYVKKELNNLIWMYGHPSLTLKQAEEIACDTLVRMRNADGINPPDDE